MALATVADFVATLQCLPLLTAEQLNQLPALQQQFPDIKTLGQELIRRQWLTLFQANQVGKGRGQELLFEQYIVLDLLGEGGMGVVFKARQARMDRLVALKVIRREAFKSKGVVERFQREVRAAAKLAHPNVVTVFDSRENNGIPFMVMEFLEGTDLSRLLNDRGPFPVPFACDCIRQAALGLQHAHEQGLVHRDIKPHNLMLTKQGVVKVMDLGLARTAHTANAGATEGLTSTGSVMGTADYIAPEQAINAKRVDIRADIYSLGCTLYQLLTGTVPFTGETYTEKLIGHQLHEPPPVEKLRSGLPKKLPAVVRQMMAKKPEKRYQTPAEVAQALEPFAKGGDSATWPAATATNIKQRVNSTADTATHQQPPVPGTLADAPRAKRKGRRLLAVALVMGVVLAGVALLSISSSVKPATTGAVAVVLPSAAARQTSVPSVTGSRETRATQPPVVTRPIVPETRPVVPPMPPTKTETPPGPAPKFEPLPGKEFITNSIGMRLVKIPAGTFTMGSPKNEQERGTDEDQHEVEITRPFYLGVFTVTQEQYEKVMKTNPSYFTATGGGKTNVQGMDTRHFPVEAVSWEDAKKFCDALSALPEEKKNGRVYRLPTEAEWEYSCRGGANVYSPFHYGDTLTSDLANFNGNAPYPSTAKKGPYLARPTPVGSYKPNAFGLYDMHGNVWQWCADWYGPYDLAQRKDPSGPATGQFRVLRGGSWSNNPRYCRSAYRNWSAASIRSNIIRFRVAVCLDQFTLFALSSYPLPYFFFSLAAKRLEKFGIFARLLLLELYEE